MRSSTNPCSHPTEIRVLGEEDSFSAIIRPLALRTTRATVECSERSDKDVGGLIRLFRLERKVIGAGTRLVQEYMSESVSHLLDGVCSVASYCTFSVEIFIVS